jgi:pilus assembly protein CpaF
MRGAEALDVMEAGRTGHTIISTFHAQDAEDAYRRIASMAMMAGVGYSEDTLLKFAYASFPIMIHKMKLADGTRKYVEIAEAQHLPNDEYKVVPLFRFIPSDIASDGRIIGEHKQLNGISDALAYRLRLGGASEEQLEPYTKVR